MPGRKKNVAPSTQSVFKWSKFVNYFKCGKTPFWIWGHFLIFNLPHLLWEGARGLLPPPQCYTYECNQNVGTFVLSIGKLECLISISNVDTFRCEDQCLIFELKWILLIPRFSTKKFWFLFDFKHSRLTTPSIFKFNLINFILF